VISLIVFAKMKASHRLILLFCIQAMTRQCDLSGWRQK